MGNVNKIVDKDLKILPCIKQQEPGVNKINKRGEMGFPIMRGTVPVDM